MSQDVEGALVLALPEIGAGDWDIWQGMIISISTARPK